jgi:hypothetical protein
LLKDHPNLTPKLHVSGDRVDRRAIHYDTAFLKIFQTTDTSQQRALAGTARSNDDHDLTLFDSQIDTSKHMELLVEPFMKSCDLDHSAIPKQK